MKLFSKKTALLMKLSYAKQALNLEMTTSESVKVNNMRDNGIEGGSTRWHIGELSSFCFFFFWFFFLF